MNPYNIKILSDFEILNELDDERELNYEFDDSGYGGNVSETDFGLGG